MRIRITPRNRSLYGLVGELYVLALSHWRVSGVDGRNRLELHFLESVLPENSDWICYSGCENSRSSGKKPNFDLKPQKTRNDSSYYLPNRAVKHFHGENSVSEDSKLPIFFLSKKIKKRIIQNPVFLNFLISQYFDDIHK